MHNMIIDKSNTYHIPTNLAFSERQHNNWMTFTDKCKQAEQKVNKSYFKSVKRNLAENCFIAWAHENVKNCPQLEFGGVIIQQK